MPSATSGEGWMTNYGLSERILNHLRELPLDQLVSAQAEITLMVTKRLARIS